MNGRWRNIKGRLVGYWREIIAGSLILAISTYALSFNHYDAYWQRAQLTLEVNGCETQTPKERLTLDVEKAVGAYENVGQVLKTAPCYTTKDALQIVLANDSVITAAAEKYQVDKAMVQAVLFQEIRFYGIEDPVADAWVRWTYQHENQLHGPVMLCRRNDSSTGIAQIYARTAMQAYNWRYGTGYDLDDEENLEHFWNNLQNDTYSIDTEAMILAWNLAETDETDARGARIEAAMARYNGTGKWAKKYGKVTFEYYQAFSQYQEKIDDSTGLD